SASLTLSGSATPDAYQAVLRTLTFDNPGATSPRTLTVKVNSQDTLGVTSAAATDTISVLVPVTTLPFSGSVTNAFVFYRGSTRYDKTGNPAAPLAFSDDNAIATDKTAYIANGAAASFNAITGYSKGINGIMVDLKGSGAHQSITLANILNDFTFKVGTNN